MKLQSSNYLLDININKVMNDWDISEVRDNMMKAFFFSTGRKFRIVFIANLGLKKI